MTSRKMPPPVPPESEQPTRKTTFRDEVLAPAYSSSWPIDPTMRSSGRLKSRSRDSAPNRSMYAKRAALPMVGYCPAPVDPAPKPASVPHSLCLGGSQSFVASAADKRRRSVTSADECPALLSELTNVAV